LIFETNGSWTKQSARSTRVSPVPGQDSSGVAAAIIELLLAWTLTRPSFPLYGKPGDMRARLARPKTVSYCFWSA
jgi:hypothetical protein